MAKATKTKTSKTAKKEKAETNKKADETEIKKETELKDSTIEEQNKEQDLKETEIEKKEVVAPATATDNADPETDSIDTDKDETLDKKELISNSKRIKRMRERAQERIERENQKCNEWVSEGNRLNDEAKQKFQSDKVKKLIALKEEDNIKAIDVMLEYYKSEIERLETSKQEKFADGESGEFSTEYKKYLRTREERFLKRQNNINKSWVIYSENYKNRKIPPIQKRIDELNIQLEELDKQIASTEESEGQ
jgi:hypothetical protein